MARMGVRVGGLEFLAPGSSRGAMGRVGDARGADSMSKTAEAGFEGAPISPSGMQALPTRRIRVIGVPLDMGASRRGVDMGPSAMRVAGL